MNLREVTLRNFRSYRSAIFKFPTHKERKRVILVGAMNGVGKTSLLMALYLGLFGREAMAFIEDFRSSRDEESRSYKELIKRILNRQALQQEDPLASVELLFEDDQDRTIKVTRTWKYTRGGNPRDLESDEGEEIRIEQDNRVRREKTWKDANNRIAELLFPHWVMPCFFFDGEQAQARIDNAGHHFLLDAVKNLFGTSLLNELDNSLKTYINGRRANMKREVGQVDQDMLEKKRQRRDDIEKDLSSLGIALKELRTRLEQLNAARQEKHVEMTQLHGDAFTDIQLLSQRKMDLETEQRDLQLKLAEGLADLALPMATRRLSLTAAARLEAEIIRDRWLLLRDETLAKVDHILGRAIPPPGNESISPPLNAQQHQQLTDRLKAALESLWSPPPPGCAEEFRLLFLGSSDRPVVLNRLRNLADLRKSDIAQAAFDLHAVKTKYKEISRQWDSARDLAPKVDLIKKRMDQFETESRGLNDLRAEKEGDERRLQAELGDLRQIIGSLEQRKHQLDPLEQKLEVAERVREVIQDSRESLKPLCKSALEEACTRHFREMISDEYQRYAIGFDDHEQPCLVSSTADSIPISTLSGAQKRAFGLAYTLAISELSGEDLPIVIDTPVGNMDSIYRKRILRYLAKTAPGQLIFLSHDEEIYGEYAEELKNYLLKTYLVSFQKTGDGVGFSSVAEDQYFKGGRS